MASVLQRCGFVGWFAYLANHHVNRRMNTTFAAEFGDVWPDLEQQPRIKASIESWARQRLIFIFCKYLLESFSSTGHIFLLLQVKKIFVINFLSAMFC